MEIKLEHHFLYTSHDIKGLLKDVKKLSTFCRKLEQQSVLFPNRYDPDKYKGDGFELFAEALIKLSPVDNRIGIGEYHPVLEGDTGVDGFGIGVRGQPVTVQVKFRSNSETHLTANQDHLSNFAFASQNRYGVDKDSSTKDMVIVTNAAGLHYFTENDMLLNKARCIDHKDLRDLVDNNILFWDSFRKLIG